MLSAGDLGKAPETSMDACRWIVESEGSYRLYKSAPRVRRATNNSRQSLLLRPRNRRTDGVTFDAIEAHGVEAFLEQIRDELTGRNYVPQPARRQEIPKDGGKVRVLTHRA
jgi:retron-type reverse transcriptase